MKCFIYEDLEKVSDNYHENGGLVVFAKSIDRAVIIANEVSGVVLDKSDTPNVIVDVDSKKQESVHVFPDAGCC